MLVTQEYLKNFLLNHQYIFGQFANLRPCYKYLLNAKHRINVYIGGRGQFFGYNSL